MIRLIDARLCLDCDTIFDEEEYEDCPRCCSRQYQSVSNLIKPFENNLPRNEIKLDNCNNK
jgi:hypothetical protein